MDKEIKVLTSVTIARRQSEIRYRAALIAEDTERREAGADLASRFQLRQVALFLDEGRGLDGATAEIVQELRSAGGYRGVPVPWAALEMRAGETVASGTPDPMQTQPIIDRLFPAFVAGRMGAQMIAIEVGAMEWPVVTSAITAGWGATETGGVAGPTVYATTDRALKPDHNLGIQMKITRKALKQSGEALEAAIRRDMQGAMSAELDRAAFLGRRATAGRDHRGRDLWHHVHGDWRGRRMDRAARGDCPPHYGERSRIAAGRPRPDPAGSLVRHGGRRGAQRVRSDREGPADEEHSRRHYRHVQQRPACTRGRCHPRAAVHRGRRACAPVHRRLGCG